MAQLAALIAAAAIAAVAAWAQRRQARLQAQLDALQQQLHDQQRALNQMGNRIGGVEMVRDWANTAPDPEGDDAPRRRHLWAIPVLLLIAGLALWVGLSGNDGDDEEDTAGLLGLVCAEASANPLLDVELRL